MSYGVLAAPILVLLAQASPAPAGAVPSPSVEAAPYRVGSGDVLEVTVRNEPELSRLPTVQTTGAVFLPRAGEVPVAGLTTAEIAARVSSRLAAPGKPEPDVTVRVKEYQSQFVWVRGEVFHPGRKPLRAGTRLVDALLDAGGFTPRSSGEVTVERKTGTFSDGSHTRTFRFEGGEPSPAEMQDLGLRLESGDVVSVATQHWVSVGGEVARPGRYPLEDGMTVSRLVESAGGLSRFASSKVTLRHGSASADSETEVDLKAVREGQAPDPVLAPGDQVVVPARRL
jgi:polysaccharide export outer membrane protein